MKRYIRDRIKNVLQLNDSPNKLALAFALGVFIAFSPTLGLHTISCLVLAWMFRLSKLVVLTAAFVNNPWTIGHSLRGRSWWGLLRRLFLIFSFTGPWSGIGGGRMAKRTRDAALCSAGKARCFVCGNAYHRGALANNDSRSKGSWLPVNVISGMNRCF
jgi:hypothetical protein